MIRLSLPKIGVRVKQRTHFPLMPMYFPLLSISASPLSTPMIMLACDVTLVWCQQVWSGGKYIGISGKWVRWFTLTPKIVLRCFVNISLVSLRCNKRSQPIELWLYSLTVRVRLPPKKCHITFLSRSQYFTLLQRIEVTFKVQKLSFTFKWVD